VPEYDAFEGHVAGEEVVPVGQASRLASGTLQSRGAGKDAGRQARGLHHIRLVLFLAATAFAQEIDPQRLRAHVKFLSSDLLEGRAPGTRGGDLAAEYIASQLAVAGAKPGAENSSWFQPVPLTGVQANRATLSADSVALDWLTDFVGQVQTQQASQSFDGEAVFVGYGIRAPEFGWDDYRGTDVKGKVVVLFTNEPASENPKFFGGRALTYYGRWTYKYEEALRQGAAACLVLHTDATAGYGWDVVHNSWGREQAQVGNGSSGLAFAGWVSERGAAKLLNVSGRRLGELLKVAGQRQFRPLSLGVRVRGEIDSRIRTISTRNVIGRISGSDPRLEQEAVLFTAHWDHLGKSESGEGDLIFNGAVDNATGCALLLEIARHWSHLPVQPRRPVMFLFTAAEEAGLRGSQYYVTKPLVPLAKTAVALNFDSFFPFGPTRDVVLDGAERTWLWTAVQGVAERLSLKISPDPRPENGAYFRSDHFPFAKAGVPAFSIKAGNQFLTQGGNAADRIKEYQTRLYHQPGDEYSDDWDFSGMEQIARFGLHLGLEAANSERPSLPPKPTVRPSVH